jgi:hypothetical protein
MAHIIADRVQETSTTTGTGAITLAGAVTGFRTFGSVMANGDTIYYTITDQSPSANWEVGVGTWNTGGTLSRTTILASSTGSAVNFTSGALYVFGTYAAGKAVYQDLNGKVGLFAGTTGSANQGAIYYGTLGYSDQNTLASFQSSVNNYNQLVVQNTNSGTQASADLTISNNLGTASTYYANFGINSSGFSGTGSFGLPNAVYVGAAGGATASDLVLGTFNSTAAGAIHFVINGGSTDAANINTSGRTFIGGSTSATALLHLAAGTATASTAPLKFTSGTNLATPEAGAVEYDGSLKYFTPTGTARALTLNSYFYRKNTATTLASATGNQSIFGLTSGVTVAANTIYEVECEFGLTTTGTTSHTESFGFTLATATVTNMGVAINRLSTTTTSSAIGGYLATVTPVVVTGALTTAQTVAYRVKGTIAFGTAGSINPVIAFSAAPGGTSTVLLGSWMKMTPIGATGSNVSIGTWA